MVERTGEDVVNVLITQAWASYNDSNYRAAIAASERSVTAAEMLGDPVLLIRALDARAGSLSMLGDFPAAINDYTRILATAEDPASAHRLDGDLPARVVFAAYVGWVESAWLAGQFPIRELLDVLDAADRWLIATGHREWRAGVLLGRAKLYRELGELDASLAAAEEALAVVGRNDPTHSLAGYRFQLADTLRSAGRHDDALPLYQAVLDDPASRTFERAAGHRGLTYCAVDREDTAAGRRHATSAVQLAEGLGDDQLCLALHAYVTACQTADDLDEAWRAAVRYLDTAARIGGHSRPFYATRLAFDVAVDRGDLDTARRLLAELDRHAYALEADTGVDTYTSELRERQSRLTEQRTEQE